MNNNLVAAGRGWGLATLLLTGFFVVAGHCAEQPSESAILAKLAGTIEPALGDAAVASRQLAESTGLLCGQKNEAGLKETRLAWRRAYLAWRTAQPMMIHGREYKAEQLLENWPTNEEVLKGATASATLAHLLSKPEVRGFSGAEFLLFSPAGVAEATAPGRCDHLLQVVAEIADQAEANRLLWQREAPAFVAAGDGNPYLLPGDALSLVFARMLNVTERMLRDRINAPSGYFDGKAKAQLLEAWRSGTSRQSLQATVDALRRLLVGDDGGSIIALVAVRDGLVSKKNPQLAKDIRTQLERIDGQIAALKDGDQLYGELQKNDKVLQPIYKSLEKLQKQIIEASLTLEVDVRGPIETMMK